MSPVNMLLVAALFSSSAIAAVVNMTELHELADPLFKRDPVPNKMGQCATYADLKWQPGKLKAHIQFPLCNQSSL